jgi:hypothetical protein
MPQLIMVCFVGSCLGRGQQSSRTTTDVGFVPLHMRATWHLLD